MDSYTEFADVYDLFMDTVPYEEWADRIDSLLKEYDERIIPDDDALKSEAGLLLELCCGTGTLTGLLRRKGYDCIGIDASEQMLQIAAEKEEDADESSRILYLNSDIRDFELYSTVGAAVCMCNSINYLTDPDDLVKTFKLVNNYLYPHGLFIFDFNTTGYFRDVLGERVIADNRPEASFIWDNYYDEESGINEYELTVFKRVESPAGNADAKSGLFVRSSETHVQRGYDAGEMRDLIEQAGMKTVKILDADTGDDADEGSLRIWIVARENGKEDIH